MKVFEQFNQSTKCKICGTNNKGKAVLIPKYETQKDGNVECEQVHLDCLDLQWITDNSLNTYFIVQSIPVKDE
jgi:hypothetical protein